MLHVIATIETTAGQRDALVAAFQELVPLVHAEDGCLAYGTAVDAETSIPAQIPLRPNVVTVVEKWASVRALEAHLAAPHMEEFRARVGNLIAGMNLQILQSA